LRVRNKFDGEGFSKAYARTFAVTVDTLDAPQTMGASPSETPTPDGRGPDGRKRGFVSRHPWLTALYSVLGFIGALILAAAVFLWLANWNMLRGPIGRYASAQTHRHVELDGDLKVHLLTWTPTVTIGGLKVGNPDWAGPGDTADVERIVVSVKLLPLLVGHVVMPILQFDRPVLNLLRDESGRENWSLGPARPNAKPFKAPPIQRFIVNDGHLKYNDLKRRMSITGVIDSNERANGPAAHAFSLVGQGVLNKKPFALKVAGGPLLNVRLDQPYPFTGDIRAADTHITASGHLAKPFDLGNYATDLHLTGRDLADLYYLTGLALPNTPTYDIKGVLTHKFREYDFDKTAGRIGDSDLEGSMRVKLSDKNRPNVTANLASRALDIKDLATLFGAPPVGKALVAAAPVQKVQASVMAADQRLLPDSTLATGRLRGMDATLHYHAQAVKSAFLPLRQASLDLKVDNGVLTINPVAFDFPQGRLWAQVKLDARPATPTTDADIRLSNVNVQEFLPHAAGATPAVEGTMAARVKLHSAGDSVHKAAAGANGAVTVVIPQGKIRAAFAELLGVNAGKGLSLLLSKNQGQTDVRCAVANFAVRDGVMQAQNVVFDTEVVKVTGTGTINLGSEAIDLTLKGDTKRFRITHVFLPIVIGGHLRGPTLGVKPASAIAQGGAAVALGAVLTPFAAILPFVDPGLAKNADCAALMNQVQTDAAPVRPSQAKGLVTTPAGPPKK
jgi:uncharacterized protein involved in outer membrane biogenesis